MCSSTKCPSTPPRAFTVAAAKKSNLVLDVRLLGPGDVDVTPGAPYLNAAPGKVSVTKFPLAASGTYRVRVAAIHRS